MMRFLWLLFVVEFTFVSLATAQDSSSYIYHTCSGANYTKNSIYQKNLNRLLSSLSSDHNDINYGFYNLSEGEGNDRVNGIALCRGDISQTACRQCREFSTVDLQQRCPNQEEAIVWYDDCMLRYSNRSIFRSLEHPALYMWNVNNVSDANVFSQALGYLLYNLRDQASSGDSRLKFAIGNTSYDNFTTIYGLVQCIPDLTKDQCSDCFDKAIRDVTKEFDVRQGVRVIGPSCNFRYDQYEFYEIPPPPASSAPPPTGRRATHLVKRPTFVIVVSTLSSVAILIGICIIIIFKRRKVKLEGEGKHIFLSSDGHDITSFESLQFDFETIRVATDNFESDNKLGQGGFGSVYKGKLTEGKEIAVKRLAYHSGQGDHEFTNEVVILAKLQHRNLVRLLGYCLEGNERLLIYEFVPNSSLDHFLFDDLKRVHLDWETRYKIISGVAKGLLYLHEDSRLRIIHRDLKAGNILLDEEMCPKIADFGLARLFILNQTQGDTTRIVGTYGYMAPEYAMHGKFSVKSDVYSFGILLLEIISGQKNSRFCIEDMPRGLPSFAWENWKAGKAQNIIDHAILDGHINDISRCIHIGLLCVQDSVSARPTMASVALMLSSASQCLPLPSEPAYLSSIEPEMTITKTEGGEVGTFTVNQVSFSSNLLPR